MANYKPANKTNKTNKKRFKKFTNRKCTFCENKIQYIDYKDVDFLKKFTTNNAKISPRRFTNNCAKHQQHVSVAIKRSREMGLLPFIKQTK